MSKTEEYLTQLNVDLPFKLKDRQEEVLENIMNEKSTLVVLPTSYGKSILFVLQALYSARIKNKKSILLAPLRSLTSEHIDTAREYGLKPMQDDGGHSKTLAEYMYSEYDVVVSTFEKQDSIIRQFDPNKIKQTRDIIYNDIDSVIIDEIHNIEDESRGVNLESYIMTLRYLYPHIKIIALSATIGNKQEFADWLDAELVFAPSSERPVPLDVSVRRLRHTNANKQFDEKMSHLISECDRYKDQKIMVAVTSVNRTKQIVKRLCSVDGDRDISFYMKRYKMAWHYSASRGLSEDDRMAIEWAFEYESLPNEEEYPYSYKRGDNIVTDYICRKDWLFDNYDLDHGINLIVCTPTLIVGRNLPISRIYVFDHQQYTFLRGPELITNNRLQQTIGRAGRLKYAMRKDGTIDPNYKGYAIIYAPFKYAQEMYDRATIPFDIESKLSDRLSEKILAWINSRIVKNVDDIVNFLSNALDQSIKDNEELIRKRMKFLLDFKFVNYSLDGETLVITNKGMKTIKYYIQPETVVKWGQTIRESIELMNADPKNFELDMFLINLMNVDEYTQNVVVNERDQQMLDLFTNIRGFYTEETATKAFMYCFPDYTRKLIRPRFPTVDNVFIVPKGESTTLLRSFSRMIYAVRDIYRKTSLKEQIETCTVLINSGTFDIKLARLVSLPKIGLVRAKRLMDNGIATKKQIIEKYRTSRLKLCSILGMNATSVIKLIKELNRI